MHWDGLENSKELRLQGGSCKLWAIGGAFLALMLLSNPSLLAKRDNQDPLNRAYNALGGKTALESLHSFSLFATGYDGALGEDYLPLDARRVNSNSVQLHYDIANDRFRLDHERILTFPLPGKRHFSHIVDGLYAYLDGNEGFPPPLFNTGSINSVRWAAIRKRQLLQNPHLLFKEVLNGNRAVERVLLLDKKTETSDDPPNLTLMLTDSVSPIKVFINKKTGRISKIATIEHDVLLCDIIMEVKYSDWQQAGDGVWFPMVVDVYARGALVHHEVRQQVTVNPDLAPELFRFPEDPPPVLAFNPAEADLGWRRHNFPQELSAMGLPFSNTQTFIGVLDSNPFGFFTTPITVAQGVYLIRGTHNTLVIEQEDGLVLVEVPLYAERGEAILDWVRQNFPEKPIKRMIATHHHMDHVGGLRTVVAAGIPIVVGEESVKFYKKKVFRASCTILPDALTANPVDPQITSIEKGGKLLLDDPNNPIMAYRIETSHAVDMIIVFLPKQGILFNSDLYNSRLPGLPLVGRAESIAITELKNAIDELNLDVKFFAGGHGAVATLEEFLEDFALIAGRGQNL